MTRKDQELLAEAYGAVNEGWFDKMRARKDQAVGAVKGVKDRVKGAAQTLGGKAVGAAGSALQAGIDKAYTNPDALGDNKLLQKGAEMQKAGAEKTSAGKASGQEAKYKSYITNSAKTIAKDLKGLGMEVGDEAALMQDIQATISKHLTQVGKSGLFKRGGGDRRGTKVGVKS
tara:strand:+ start:159 stop:677 length:519 start_codon:yes stop_codon:yes gene_type:complete